MYDCDIFASYSVSAFIHVHIGMSVSIEKKRTKLTGLERKCSDGLILDGLFHLFS